MMMMGGPPPPPPVPGGPPGPPPPLPPGGMMGAIEQAARDRQGRVVMPQGGANDELLSEIERAAQAAAAGRAARQVPQGGANSQLLSEIEQAAQARAAGRAVQLVPQQGGDGTNMLLEEIRAAGGSPRGRIDQWLTQGGTGDYEEAIRLGESAVSPVMTASRSASPPPPSAYGGQYTLAPAPARIDDGPVNHVQELLMRAGLTRHRPASTVAAQQQPNQQQPPQQFQPGDHVSTLLMRHELHDTADVYELAAQMQQHAELVPQTFQQMGYAQHQYQQQHQQQQQQQQLRAVPGAPALQPTIWGKMLETAQSNPYAQPQQSGTYQQQGQQPSGMMLPHSLLPPGQGMPMPTSSTYQQTPGRQIVTVPLEKRAVQAGGNPTFGMSITMNDQHRRIEVTNVSPSTLPPRIASRIAPSPLLIQSANL